MTRGYPRMRVFINEPGMLIADSDGAPAESSDVNAKEPW